MIQNIPFMVFEGKNELMVFRFPPLRVAIGRIIAFWLIYYDPNVFQINNLLHLINH